MIMKILSKKYILSASLLVLGGAAMAQNLNSAYFTEGYHLSLIHISEPTRPHD